MTETRTDVDAIAELASTAAINGEKAPPAWTDLDPDTGEVEGSLAVFAIPEGHALASIDTELLGAMPRRAIGIVKVHDAAGFARAIRQRATKARDGDVEAASPYNVAIYADEEAKALVAILNDDVVVGDDEFAGWRDHRVELALRPRPEWVHWTGGSDKDMDQAKFALHIEKGLDELRDPNPADMLDLAQHFQATTSGRFAQGNRLAGGKRELLWSENADVTAGENGTLSVPEELILDVRPFYGSDKWEVRARFYYRLIDGKLTMGYRLVRPHDVEAAAFKSIVDGVETELAATIIAGQAPGARTAITSNTPVLPINIAHNKRGVI